MSTSKRNSPEVRERAVRLFEQALGEHSSRWAATKSVSEKLGCTTETLRRRVKQAEIDEGKREGLTTDERQQMKDLQREVSELKQELKGQSKAWKHTDAPQESSTARDSRVPRATFL